MKKKDSLIVLEFGTGLYSTKNISVKLNSFKENITIKNKHMFLSLDHSHEWLKKTEKDFKAIEKFTNHVFIYSGGDSKDNWIKTIKNLSLNLKGSIPDLVFIDYFPWESRTLALNEFKNIGKIIMIHDVDYYPHNNIWGEELDPIKNKPISRWRYGNLKKENLGYRDYSKIFEYWIEFFPFEPGYFIGPPTLIGSNLINVKKNLLENLQKKRNLPHLRKKYN